MKYSLISPILDNCQYLRLKYLTNPFDLSSYLCCRMRLHIFTTDLVFIEENMLAVIASLIVTVCSMYAFLSLGDNISSIKK